MWVRGLVFAHETHEIHEMFRIIFGDNLRVCFKVDIMHDHPRGVKQKNPDEAGRWELASSLSEALGA
jgi:hypothetical protein